LHYHFIFSTKHRQPTITPDFRSRLYDYVGGIFRNLDGILIAAGGISDHVHLLARLTQNHSVAEVLRVVKANSSKWVREVIPTDNGFGWQNGYGAFGVSYSNIEPVMKYIANQEVHHRAVSFQEEFLTFLRKQNVTFDPERIWE
jgi:REP element-mobilizing transposase RayT